MSQQDYLNSIRNQDSFTIENYSEQLRDNPHVGKELSIIYFDHQDQNRPHPRSTKFICLTKKLVEP